MHLVRNIRTKLLNIHNLISGGFETEAELEQFRILLERHSKELSEEYE